MESNSRTEENVVVAPIMPVVDRCRYHNVRSTRFWTIKQTNKAPKRFI